MGMTLTQLRTRVREILKLPNQTDIDEGLPTKDQLTKMINEAMNRRYAQLVGSFPFRFITKSTAFTYTALAENVTLPAGVPGRMVSLVRALPLSVTSSIESYTLEPVGIEELDTYAFYGIPVAYVIDMVNSSIWLRPVPQSDTTLFIHYVASLTDLSSDSDTPSLFPSEFHQLFAYDVAIAWAQESGDEIAAVLEPKADAIYESLKIFVERNYQDTRFKKRVRGLF